MSSLTFYGPVAEGFRIFVPLEKGDHRGSEAIWQPPAAEGAGKLSQSFHSLAKGNKRNCNSLREYSPSLCSSPQSRLNVGRYAPLGRSLGPQYELAKAKGDQG